MSSTPSSTRTNLLAGAAALVVMVVAFLVLGGTSEDVNVVGTNATIIQDDTAAAASEQTTATTLVETSDTITRFSDLPTITLDELPIEAIETLLLIDDGGPYPYRQDDGTFQNREGILPDRPREHYREYTVDTPGSADRGARRVVSGADGERYYTNDHYDSFPRDHRMSGLAMVTGRLAPGVWRGGSMSSTDLTTLAESLGWVVRCGQIDATDDKVAYLTQLGTIAGVPSYVRANWDSLADGLRDTGIEDRWLLAIETNVATPFDHTAIDILNEAVTFWNAQGATMQVVWFGPVDAPDLDQVDPVRRSRR